MKYPTIALILLFCGLLPLQAETAEVWTCSMHPQIHRSEPGDCPICGMDLIPLTSNVSSSDSGPVELTMSESAKALAGIQTSTVRRQVIERELSLVGKLDYDETRLEAITARFPLRIDKLYINYTGAKVVSGEPLADVYSPELLTAQKELINAYRADPRSSVTRAAEEKLRLWGLTAAQIKALIDQGYAGDSFQITVPFAGTVLVRQVEEGNYLQTGQVLLKIADLSHLWLWLEAYESDVGQLSIGQNVSFSVQAYPGEVFHGQIAFIAPELNRSTRTIPVRVNLSNEDTRLKPGMLARGNVHIQLGLPAPQWTCSMHPEVIRGEPGECPKCGMDLIPLHKESEVPLTVPESAVLQTGKRAVVYVEKQGSQTPAYEGREVVLGAHGNGAYIVLSGLSEGEKVVTEGAFKIDSALQIQAKPSMMNPPEHAEMAHQQMAPVAASHGVDAAKLDELLSGYYAMHAALAADDFAVAQNSAGKMMQVSGHHGPLADLLHEILAAEGIEALRKPLFDKLSALLAEAVKQHPEAVHSEVFLMHCPMVYGDHGADWLQPDSTVENPYFGSMMLRCGDLKERLTP